MGDNTAIHQISFFEYDMQYQNLLMYEYGNQTTSLPSYTNSNYIFVRTFRKAIAFFAVTGLLFWYIQI